MRRLLVLASLLCVAFPAAAQTPAEHRQLLAWSDTLERAKDLATLPTLEALQATGRTANLRKDMLRLRRAEVAGDMNGWQTGIAALLMDASQHPDWPWPKYLMAKSFIRLHERRAQNGRWEGQLDGESLASTAWRLMAEALRADRQFGPARELFFEKMVASGDRVLHDEQLDPLQAELREAIPDPRALLAWGRVLRADEKYDSAMKVFVRAALGGEDRGRLALERARTFRMLGDTAAARSAYWDGLERVTPATRVAYRYDLSWIVGDDSLKLFDATPDDSLADWMRRFWDQRDAAAANHFGDRLQEHMRRWGFVTAHYRVVKPWRKTDFTRTDVGFDKPFPNDLGTACLETVPDFYERLWALQPTYPGDIRDRERLLDQRGLMYLRHGAPIREFGGGRYDTLSLAGGGEPPYRQATQMQSNISWLYWIGGDWRLLHFRGSAALGMQAPTTLGSYLPWVNPVWYADVMEAPIQSYSDAYNALLLNLDSLGPTQKACRPQVKEAAVRSRNDVTLAATTDSDSPPLSAPWDGRANLYALGSVREKNGRGLVSFAIPANRLVRSADDSSSWAVHFRIVAYEAATSQHITIDTVQTFPAIAKPGDRDFAAGWFDVPLGPGSWQVAIRMQQTSDTAGMYFLKERFVIDGSDRFALSDIVPGIAAGKVWRAPDGQPFALNPFGSWKATSPMSLYYEVHGVPLNTSYKATLVISRDDDEGKALITVASNDRSSGLTSRVRKTLGLQALKPDRYRLTVTLEYDGRKVVQVLPFTVIKP